MKVRVLGSAAGGGLPQWNCGCVQCRAARDGSDRVTPRTQSSLAVSDDSRNWVLLNASPDVRTQLAAFPDLGPPDGSVRGSGIAAVALTNGDIDHCAGLLVLREGGAPPIYSTARVREALTDGLSILPALGAYGKVDWRELVPGRVEPVTGRNAAPIGVSIEAFVVASKPPPYMLRILGDAPVDALAGDTVGMVLRGRTGGSLAYVPGVRELDAALAARFEGVDVVMVDGTFFTDDELVTLGASQKTATAMGHAPLDGDRGLIRFLARFPRQRKILVHINNSNPILTHDSDARRAVQRAGIEIAHDGMEIVA